MRRTWLSWPVEAIVLAVPVICGSGAAYAQSARLEDQQAPHMATLERVWIPAGSLPIPQKPKVSEGRDTTGVDEYPSGAPIIPPKPKLTSSIQY